MRIELAILPEFPRDFSIREEEAVWPESRRLDCKQFIFKASELAPAELRAKSWFHPVDKSSGWFYSCRWFHSPTNRNRHLLRPLSWHRFQSITLKTVMQCGSPIESLYLFCHQNITRCSGIERRSPNRRVWHLFCVSVTACDLFCFDPSSCQSLSFEIVWICYWWVRSRRLTISIAVDWRDKVVDEISYAIRYLFCPMKKVRSETFQ